MNWISKARTRDRRRNGGARRNRGARRNGGARRKAPRQRSREILASSLLAGTATYNLSTSQALWHFGITLSGRESW
jgi:hypothetical protein